MIFMRKINNDKQSAAKIYDHEARLEKTMKNQEKFHLMHRTTTPQDAIDAVH